ncbi:unnamed protein product [Mytilus edulis]|uniref:Uncharacterized protein n=1 Tax=Mytilus edulis TaxID=6550 RepID=A0A8S3RNJ6_MYTED|nr:unnamed protein product [Mytilus edulis]
MYKYRASHNKQGLSCNTTEFECDNGKCIANSLICNVDFDCYDSPEPLTDQTKVIVQSSILLVQKEDLSVLLETVQTPKQIALRVRQSSTVLFSPTESTVLSTSILTSTPPIHGTQPDDTNDPEFSSLSVVIAIAIVCAILIVLVATVLIRSVQFRNNYSRLNGNSLSHNGDSINTVTTDDNTTVFHMVTVYPAKSKCD